MTDEFARALRRLAEPGDAHLELYRWRMAGPPTLDDDETPPRSPWVPSPPNGFPSADADDES